MNRFIVISLSLILFLPFLSFTQGTGKSTKVSGQLTGNQVYTEISLRSPTRESTVVATSPITADGKFSLVFNQLDPNLYRLYLADNNVVMLVLQPGDEVSLTLDAVNAGLKPQIKGSQEIRIFWDFSNQFNIYAAGIDSVETVWKENQQKPGMDSLFSFLRGRYTYYDSLEKKAIKEYITTNPGSLTGLVYIDKLDIDENFAVFDKYDQVSFKKYPSNPFILEFHNKVAAARATSIGNMAPDIKLPNPEGVEKSLSSLKGKIVLVDFWAAWCGPCRKENPHVREMYKKYHDKGFEVFGVSLDRDAEAWKKAIKADSLEWTQVSDLKYWKSEPAKLYGVSAIPHTILIDKDGKIIGKKLRGESLTRKLEEIYGF